MGALASGTISYRIYVGLLLVGVAITPMWVLLLLYGLFEALEWAFEYVFI